ncbi:MAG: hypothetical protein QN229_07280 [Desulfurococcaceae archaeon TW002]
MTQSWVVDLKESVEQSINGVAEKEISRFVGRWGVELSEVDSSLKWPFVRLHAVSRLEVRAHDDAEPLTVSIHIYNYLPETGLVIKYDPDLVSDVVRFVVERFQESMGCDKVVISVEDDDDVTGYLPILRCGDDYVKII